MNIIINPIQQQDGEWVSQAIKNLWGSMQMVSRGKLTDMTHLDGYIAYEEERKVGLVTYEIEDEECEIMSINSLIPGKGIGSLLLEAVEQKAKERGCKKLVVITTNDNMKAVEFYQKRGFTIAIVRKNIMDEYRKLKPEIPLIGNDGIPLTDEIELQKDI